MKANSKKPRNTRVQRQEIPVNDAPSNEQGDKFAFALFLGLLTLSAVILGGGLYWSASNLAHDFRQPPYDWVNAGIMVLTLVLALLVARALLWFSVLGPIILGTRMNAWRSLDAFAQKGMVVAKIQPGGSAWLSTALVQSLVNRGQYDEAIAAANAEWERSGSIDRYAQNLGTLCFAAGIAEQAKSDLKKAQTWNERAIGVLNKSMEQMLQPKKGIMAKVAAQQSDQVIGQFKIQLAAAYFNNATIYFNNQDFRRARENYKLAVDNAVKAPEFPQKGEIIRFGNEQLGRLKHA